MITNSEAQQRYRVRHPYRARVAVALNSARTRARNHGIPFALTASDLPPVPDRCPVLGIPLVLWGNTHKSRDSSPSLDRIIPELGYVPGNVAWISTRANILKRDASADELLAVAKYVKGGMSSGSPSALVDYLLAQQVM